ncbi:endonuclease domain-containing protein [Candidatus Falkowbacteria bacterium]|nr:endonuclease domain-containing protein [Candidatus Falkowbacteria bacterium]
MQYLCNDESTKNRRRELRKKQTESECKIWNILRDKQMRGLRFFRQYSIGQYILDFYCPCRRIAIEIDGEHHAESAQKTNDERRTLFLSRQNIQVIRFWNNDVLKNMEGVWRTIYEAVGNNSD